MTTTIQTNPHNKDTFGCSTTEIASRVKRPRIGRKPTMKKEKKPFLSAPKKWYD
jgi:hypothetical protein